MSSPLASPRFSLAVVNDHELVVRGVAAMLEPYADRIEIVELDCDLPVARPVDIALYDAFSMPALTSHDIDDLVRNRRVGRTVLYTWVLTPEVLRTARERGISAAVPKSLTAAQLADVLERVHAGEVLFDPGMADHVTIQDGGWPGKREGLTARESEVVALVTEGLSNNEIARRTYLSINSVKSYIRSAYRTMGVSSRSQAVLWGIDHGFARDRCRVLPSPSGEYIARSELVVDAAGHGPGSSPSYVS